MPKNKRFKQIIILGAGAIGSYYGALLSKYNKVHLIGNREHTDSINKHGLQLLGAIKDTFEIKASSTLNEIPLNSLLLVTTKAYDLEESLKTIKTCIKKDTTILLLQNGLGNEELGYQILGPSINLVRGISTAGIEFVSPGKIDVKYLGETMLPATDAGTKISIVLTECNMKTTLSNNMRYEIWKKLTMNCVINPLTAIFRVPNREISVSSLKGIRDSVISECRAVAAMEGIILEAGLEESLSKILSEYSNLSSMCQDILKGKQTEIEFLNGKVSLLGDKYNIPTPVNDTLASLIRFMEGKIWR